MNNREKRERLIAILTELKEEGFKVYITQDNSSNPACNFVYGYIITPSENILCISKHDLGGWDIHLKYKPSKKCGSGCQCNDEGKPYMDISKEVILQAERAGLAFARELKAPLYKSLEEMLNGHGMENWTKRLGDMVEL